MRTKIIVCYRGVKLEELETVMREGLQLNYNIYIEKRHFVPECIIKHNGRQTAFCEEVRK